MIDLLEGRGDGFWREKGGPSSAVFFGWGGASQVVGRGESSRKEELTCTEDKRKNASSVWEKKNIGIAID